MSSHTGKMTLAKKIILKKSLDCMIFLCHRLNAFFQKCFHEDNFENKLLTMWLSFISAEIHENRWYQIFFIILDAD